MNTVSKIAIALFIAIANLHVAHSITPADSLQAGSQYYAYPVPDRGIPTLTKSPKGYVPFHIEHYGRHGSRWLIGHSKYSGAINQLEIADKKGKLTPRGKEVLEQLRPLAKEARTRDGELTPLGHRQHRGIANRMYHNFPTVFSNGSHVDAKSTQVIRCILSMANEIQELKLLNPEIIVTMDASATTQPVLNNTDLDNGSIKAASKAYYLTEAIDTLPFDKSHFFQTLFNDQQFVADNIDSNSLFNNMFEITTNAQSHDDYPDFYDLFTAEMLQRKWKANNASWFVRAGNSDISDGRVPFNQRFLLNEMIASADTAIISPNLSANLRFGHEVVVLPLAVFMELDHYGDVINDLSNLDEKWRNYEIFPMASNIQLIFYRPELKKNSGEDKILVKALLNEREVTLPVKPFDGPYYRWTDLRDYYKNKIDSFSSRFKE